jgi:DNA replication protein DnaC
MMSHTLNQLRQLKLSGMTLALERQQESTAVQALSFDERLGMLVDEEINFRENRRLARILKEAKLKFPAACVEDIDYGSRRNLDRSLMAGLQSCDWVRHHQNILLTGATGCGKTWLACALANQAARKGFTVLYRRTPRLLEALEVGHGDGSLPRLRQQLAKAHVLILDDWGMSPLSALARSDLLEIIDDRVGCAATIVTSQLPVDAWHEYIGDPTLADAILDRLIHTAHRLALKGDSLRKMRG